MNEYRARVIELQLQKKLAAKGAWVFKAIIS